ncbi:serine/threonine-protein phosphatase 6 regulatory ankyrin repeat subunit A-like isoform X1 [Triticum dicoccoides]|uniref:serine/threonine-protein phosphatase 6 regulatory ankyrin repeat subunit A-like isoform X1 n=1 Tax=Triticum dicoccoides TaxID=85692 RepID=UPI00188E2481|nr:serine/threonine-protein phosphatase 6 regulatory ankyrin repeat subunit A-like isoform X1 [Triticum dicoccoides]XP_037483658.1 serine/threonine-protein phosphatase 6 regulatory ankyrin repeat subunit A-like isoform X1 [Triticum dicoccoides]
MADATKPLHPVLQAVDDGNLRLLKGTSNNQPLLLLLPLLSLVRTLRVPDRPETAGVVADDGIWSRALVLAAMNGRLDVCRCLVEDLRVDVNQRTFTGDTALAISAAYGTAAITKYLLDRGADPTLVGALWPPLHGAAMSGECEILELLLSAGIDVDCFDSVYGTPLHAAAAVGEDGAVNILLEHHADPNKILNLHSTPLNLSILFKSLECVKLLIKAGADVNKIDHNGYTYLMVAADICLPGIMKCLLDAGANPDIPDPFGTTAIEIAALRGRRDMVEMLFPLASTISTLPDWSVDGIICHVKSCGLPKDIHLCEKKRAELKLQATEAFKRKEHMIAVELYTCAMNFEPSAEDLAILLANRSLCLLRSGRGKDALSDATRCTMLRPLWPKGYYRLGAALMFLEDYEEASRAFADGLELDPANADIANALREAQEAVKNPPCTGELGCLSPLGIRRSR